MKKTKIDCIECGGNMEVQPNIEDGMYDYIVMCCKDCGHTIREEDDCEHSVERNKKSDTIIRLEDSWETDFNAQLNELLVDKTDKIECP
jgi:hypothetical protein